MARTHCPFLSLPRELRDNIYRYSFEDGSYGAREGKFQFTVLYGDAKEDLDEAQPDGSLRGRHSVKPPMWLFVCKQVMTEGLEYFHSQATCVNLGGFGAKDTIAISVISLARLKRIHLTQRSRRIVPEPEVEELQRDTSLEQIEGGSSLLDYCRTHDMAVNDFSLRVKVPGDKMLLDGCCHEEEELIDQRLDLASLQSIFTGLERVEFIISEPAIDADRPRDIREMAGAYLKVQQDLVNLGGNMIQGTSMDGSTCIARDWMQERPYISGLTGQLSIQHNWHLEFRCGPQDKERRNSIRYEGMRCWVDFPWMSDHFASLSDSTIEHPTWYSAINDWSISVRLPSDIERLKFVAKFGVNTDSATDRACPKYT